MNIVTKYLLIISTLLFCYGPVLYAQALPKSITIGFLPGGNVDNLKKGAVQVAQGLQDSLNIPVKVYISKDYSGLIEAMKKKEVDFAFFTAMTYVFAEKEASAKVLLKKVWKEPFYHSMILVKKNSKINKAADLKQKRIAFVDEKSTSGYLYPRVYFQKNKIELSDFKSVQFSGTHSKSVQLLEKDQVDVIAIFSDDHQIQNSAYMKYAQSEKKDKEVRALWVSEAIPNDPFCVRQDFYDKFPKLSHDLMMALIDLVDEKHSNPEFQEAIGSQSLMTATNKQYDPVRTLVSELKLKP